MNGEFDADKSKEYKRGFADGFTAGLEKALETLGIFRKASLEEKEKTLPKER